MLPDRVIKRLGALEEVSKQGKWVKDLFRLMENPDLWLMAYANIYANAGATTPGIDAVTMDGFSPERASNLMALLKEKLYNPKPVRRAYIPKKNGKKRPLGLPSGDDKLVQEVTRILLERIYEPVFSQDSHGFRPKRSCHTALQQIQRTWKGVKWIVNVDIQGFYDNINHRKLVEVLEKKIDDKRFIKLIELMLTAGYVEDWKFYRTYSGVPQGGIVSPLLANIYLHELDTFIQEMKGRFNIGKYRAMFPEYTAISTHISKLRTEIDRIKMEDNSTEKIRKIQHQITRLDAERKAMPSGDPFDRGYKRLTYCRYADDFTIGIIGSKEDAKAVFDEVQQFVEDKLSLKVAIEKSGIHHGKEGITYLGYLVRMESAGKVIKKKRGTRYFMARTVAGNPKLRVPPDRARAFCQDHRYANWSRKQPRHKPEWMSRSDVEIILAYNAELRGLANYYCLADDVKEKLNPLAWMWIGSLLKTLAAKHKTTVKKISQRLQQGNGLVYKHQVKGKDKVLKVYSLKNLKRTPKNWQRIDVKARPGVILMRSRSELVERLSADKCEYCGKSEGYFEVHHVRKLKDVQGKELWERIMIAMRRKTLILCIECHDLLHSGKLPDWRHQTG